jgi:SAM-dependent methyltransferase
MRSLLPQFIDCVNTHIQNKTEAGTSRPILVDLGCGTGRNTIQLLDILSANRTDTFDVIGLDASPGMLEVARGVIKEYTTTREISQDISLGIIDLLQPVSLSQLPPSLGEGAAGVISTLVLEHIPLARFFEAASAIMRPGAYLLVTNMHAEMGMRSQAGFTDPESGVKIRPTSYCHAIPEVLEAAKEAGFSVEQIAGTSGDGDGECENGVLVQGVDESLGLVLGARAKKWVGVKVWFGVCFRKAS